jgi:hypothetical protein
MMLAVTNWFEWILAKLPVLIFVLVFIAQALRGLFRGRGEKSPPAEKPNELDEQRRVREVQEEIRRRIAERRSAPPPPLPPAHPPQPVERRFETTQMPEPMGDPLRRMFEDLKRQIAPTEPEPPPVPAPRRIERHAAEIDRQQRLADQLKDAEAARALAQRRAANVVAEKRAESQQEPALRSAARESLLADLRGADSLRRAFVLREVLGPPVGLR